MGLVLPGLVELYYVAPVLLYQKHYGISRYVEILVAVAVISGGFILRYVVVVAGQITGPIGL
jgi:formate-dependent nitrite reductase membrane component NrfD